MAQVRRRQGRPPTPKGPAAPSVPPCLRHALRMTRGSPCGGGGPARPTEGAAVLHGHHQPRHTSATGGGGRPAALHRGDAHRLFPTALRLPPKTLGLFFRSRPCFYSLSIFCAAASARYPATHRPTAVYRQVLAGYLTVGLTALLELRAGAKLPSAAGHRTCVSLRWPCKQNSHCCRPPWPHRSRQLPHSDSALSVILFLTVRPCAPLRRLDRLCKLVRSANRCAPPALRGTAVCTSPPLHILIPGDPFQETAGGGSPTSADLGGPVAGQPPARAQTQSLRSAVRAMRFVMAFEGARNQRDDMYLGM